MPGFPKRRRDDPVGDSVIAQADTITAQRHVVGGRVLVTFVALNGGEAFATSTVPVAPPSTPRQAWWTHEPEEYDGA